MMGGMYKPGDILILRVQRLPVYEHRSTPAYHESTKRVEVRTVVGDAAVAHDYVVKETKKVGATSGGVSRGTNSGQVSVLRSGT